MTEPDDPPDLDDPDIIEPADVLAARSVSGRDPVPLGPQRCIALLRGLTSPDVDQRIGAAEGPGDLRQRGSLDAREGCTLAWVLAWAAAVDSGWYPEPVADLRPPVTANVTRQQVSADRWPVRQGYLYSLYELAADGWVPAVALRRVTASISPAELGPTEAGRYERLVTARSWPTVQPPPDELPSLPGARAGEPVGPQAAIDMVRGLAGADVGERRVSAQAVEWAVNGGRLDDDEASTLGVILTWALRVEGADARGAQLAALAALARRDRVPPWALDEVLADLADVELDEAERLHRDTLGEALAGHRRRAAHPDPA